METTLVKKQKKTFRADYMGTDGRPEVIVATVRYDDDYGNRHNSFAITADIYTQDRHTNEPKTRHKNGKVVWMSSGGCLHEDVAKHFPNLAPLIKWHLYSSDGPMHYIANTSYHAGAKDCWGRCKGEPSSFDHVIRFGDSPVSHKTGTKFWKWLQTEYQTAHRFHEVVAISHPPDTHKYSDHYTFKGFGDKWHECPFSSKAVADEWREAVAHCVVEFDEIPTAFSEGGKRDLDAARHCAAWPDATNAELTDPGLKERLEARLPALLEAFQADVESLGFTF